MSRPSKFNENIANTVLERFASGERLTDICWDDGMPARNTVYRWRQKYPEFGQAYLAAQEEHADALIDKAGEIVDTEFDPQRARVRSDHYRWLASRLNKPKYSERMEIQTDDKFEIGSILKESQERLAQLCEE